MTNVPPSDTSNSTPDPSAPDVVLDDPAPALSLTTRPVADRTVIQITGDVDAHTAPELRARLLEVLRAGDRQLVVNLDEVEFMDSSGLGVLVAIRRRLQHNDGLLRVVCTREPILKVFRITKLDRAFPIHTSVDEALKATA